MQTKRLLSAFLALVMVMSMVTVPVSAEDTITSCTKTTGCTLADGHTEECSVPTEPIAATYCDNESCLLHTTQAHEACLYCTNEDCTIRGEAHTECKLPEETTQPAAPTCTCADKCNVDEKNAACEVCKDATADTLTTVCTGKEPVYENCDVEGCSLVKGHGGDHTGAGNFVECTGSNATDDCGATTHAIGCPKVVAAIGSVAYTSLNDAVNNANENDIVVLYKDVDKLPLISKAITIQGVNTTAPYVNVAGGAGENQFGTISGTVTLQYLNFVNGTEAIRTDYTSAGYSNLTLRLLNCNFNNLHKYAVMGGATTDSGNHMLNKLVVDKCTFNASTDTYGNNYMVYAQCVKDLVITNSVFIGNNNFKGAIHTGDATDVATVANISGNTIKGFARGIQVGNRVAESLISIDKNSFENIGATTNEAKSGVIYIHSNANVNANVSITENKATNSDLLLYNDNNTGEGDLITDIVETFTGNTADGAPYALDEKGELIPSDPVAQVDTKKYASFVTAINDAQDNETVKLLKNITTDEMFSIEKAITIDGNGNTITATRSDSAPFFVKANADVSFSNLIIKGNGTKYGIYSSQTSGSLNLDKVTISGQSHYAVALAGSSATENPSVSLNVSKANLSGYSAISVWTPNAKVTVNESTLTSSNAWGNPSSNSYATVSAHVACEINITKSSVEASAASGSVQSAIGTTAGVSGVTVTMDKDTELKLSGEGETYLLGAEIENNTFVFPAVYTTNLNGEGCITETYTAIDGTVKVTGTAVAKDSDGKMYGSLQAAVNAGGTITVLYSHDVANTVTIPENKTVVLDLNDKTVTLPGIVNNGTLTVKNGTLNGNTFQDVIVSYGKLTVDGLTASGTRHVLRIKEGTATIESGTFTALGTVDTTCHVLNVGDDSTNATVTVNGGTFIAAEGKNVDSSAAIAVQNASKVTVNGGDFSKGMSGNPVDLFVVSSSAKLELTGGSYDVDVNDFCAADYKAVKKNDTTWEVVAKTYVAQDDDGTKYESLVEAVEKAESGDTITLIADTIVIDKTETVTVDKKVTVNLNGKTINAGGDAFTVVTGGDLTINGNGTVNAGTAADGSYCAVWTNGGGTVTINGGTYSVDAKSDDYNDLIYAKGGSITITGGYFNSENTQWSNNGKYYVLNQNNSNPGTISVKGGTFENYDPADGDDAVENDSFIASGFCSATRDDGATYTVAAHTRVRVPEVKATCKTDGNIEHYKCTNCGTLYKTATGDETLTEEQIKTTGTHDLKYQGGKLATYDAAGIHPHYYCEVTGCGEKFEDARGETPFEGSTVITMLSHVEDGVLVVDEDAITNEGKKNVVLDLLQKDVMGSLTAVTEVQFQKACLEDHVDRGGTLWVYLSDGQVYFDNDALDTIVNKAEGSTVTLLVDEITKTDSGLTAKQKTTLNGKKDPYIVRLQLTSGGKRITADFDGKVYVYLTEFEPKTGYKNSNYSAFFLDEDGTTDAVSYYSRDARITVEHFSEYFLARNVKAASNPTTGDTSNVMVWAGVGLAAVAALVVLLILNRKKKAE